MTRPIPNRSPCCEVSHAVSGTPRAGAVTRTLRAGLSLTLGIAIGLFALVERADALPSFARQTEQACSACHVGGDWPQLTPWGRFFKLSGYTAGKRFVASEGLAYSPVGAFAQAGVTWAAAASNAAGQPVVQPSGALRAEQAAAYFGGKLADFAGVFYEYQESYNYPGWTGATGVMDARAVQFFNIGSGELLVGLDVNNGPTNQDVWNTVPAWAYPFYGSPIAPGAPASTMLATLIGQSGGVGVYGLWNRTVYGEVALYRAGTGPWRWATIGTSFDTPGGANYLAGYNPYWRLTWNDAWGPHNLMLGTYGMQAKVYPDNTVRSGATDRFTDLYLDAQYQYLIEGHTLTVRGTWYHERQSWDGSFPQGLSSTPTGNLSGYTMSATYALDNRWTFSAAYGQSNGSGNAALYAVTGPNGSTLSTSPNTTNYVLQANYLPTQNIKLQLQYSGFTRFNGLSSNIDGLGRSPADNNTLWFNLFFAL